MPNRPPAPDDVHGLLLVDKPAGWTSHDVVAKVRGHFRLRKVGHGGTLDPMATGLLVLLLGRGTRLSERVMGSDKVYEGALRLGRATDTEDADGTVVEERDWRPVTAEQVAAAMARRQGDQMQTPPMVSAVKRDGVPLYKLARKGKTVEREPRLIHVYSFTLLDFAPPDAAFRMACTKGTYVRTLCADIGRELGCGAHLARLRRTASGAMRVADAQPLEAVLAIPPEALAAAVIPMERALAAGL